MYDPVLTDEARHDMQHNGAERERPNFILKAESEMQAWPDDVAAEWVREMDDHQLAAVFRDCVRRHTDFFVGDDERCEGNARAAVVNLRNEYADRLENWWEDGYE